jgi:hypothetical protein
MNMGACALARPDPNLRASQGGGASRGPPLTSVRYPSGPRVAPAGKVVVW